MSVYTQLETHDFETILSQYALGTLVKFEGIAAGIENTNYKITLDKAGIQTPYFLTIFEEISSSELDFFMPFLSHLKKSNCKLPEPNGNLNGVFLFTVQDDASGKVKSGAIFECLSGGHIETIKQKHCELIGQELANIHLAGKSYPQIHENSRGFYWLQKQINGQHLHVSADDQALLTETLQRMQHTWHDWNQNDNLQKGFIHADLFPDNCLFANDTELSGVIDFYAGGHDFLAYDLAITIMAWCQTPEFKIDPVLADALLKGYESVRPLHEDELMALPEFIVLATLRFWVSRLVAQEQLADAALTTPKNPDEMKRLLLSL